MVSDSSFNREEVLSDIDKAITALAQSLGIRAPVDEEKSGALNEITLEGGLVAAILQTAKGKRLLSRSFELLPPDYRYEYSSLMSLVANNDGFVFQVGTPSRDSCAYSSSESE